MNPIDRRAFLATTLAATACSAVRSLPAEDARRHVSWLAEIQTPPETLPADAPQLSNLLVDDEGTKITRLEQWGARRRQLLKWWMEFLGPLPTKRKAVPKLEVIAEDSVAGVVRQLVKYDVEPGITTEAYLCKPAKIDGQVPGIVVFHSTVDHSIRQPAGVEGAPEKAFGLRYAKQGMITFSPRNYLWPETGRIAAQQEAEKYAQRVPGSKGMTKMVYDAAVALDILTHTPDVDSQRIGAVGHSLGAKEVLYLAALDQRVKVTISSEGGVGTRFSNWEAPWYLGPSIQEPAFTHEHHELLALAAPRPFLLIGGQSADGDRGWPFIERALAVYRLYGEPGPIGQFNHRQGHAVPEEALERMDQWLRTYL